MTLPKLTASLVPALTALVAMAVGCSHPPVTPRAAPDFVSGRVPVKTVALLPVDVNVSVKDEDFTPQQAGALQSEVIRSLTSTMTAALSRRGYRVVTQVHPDGTGRRPDGKALPVIHPTDLKHLRIQIHRASRGGKPGLEATVSTDLAGQVGRTTGADASLYARSWLYLAPGSDDRSTAVTVLIAVLLIVLVVGIIVMVVASKGKGGGKGALKATGKIAKGAAYTAMMMGRVALRTAPHVAMAIAQAHHANMPCYTCGERGGGPGPSPPPGPSGARGAPPPGDTLVLRQDTSAPERSTVGLFVSMVHNKTGRMLWHAQQELELRVEEGADAEDLAEHFLKHLPAAAGAQAR